MEELQTFRTSLFGVYIKVLTFLALVFGKRVIGRPGRAKFHPSTVLNVGHISNPKELGIALLGLGLTNEIL